MMVNKASLQHIKEYIELYENARKFMISSGNPHQWAGKDFASDVEKDIKDGVLYEIREDGALSGVFAMLKSPDHTYDVIEGKWLTQGDYYVIHRVASAFTQKHFLEKVVSFVSKYSKVIRIDTHKDNIPMQKAILRCGFQYCGIIYIKDGSPRLAYERLL